MGRGVSACALACAPSHQLFKPVITQMGIPAYIFYGAGCLFLVSHRRQKDR